MLWTQATCVLVLAFAIAVAQDVASSGGNFSGEPEIRVPSHFESLKVPYHLTPKTRYPSEKLRSSSTSDCLIGAVPCPDGSEVCINPFKYLGCAFDAISPIKLDDLAKGMADVLEGFVSDSAEFAEEAVRDFVESDATCWKGIAGKSTDCSTLGTFEACLDSALAVLTAGKIAAIKQAKKAQEVMEQTNSMCKYSCRSGSCSTSSDTHQYKPPSGCTCKDMQFITSGRGPR